MHFCPYSECCRGLTLQTSERFVSITQGRAGSAARPPDGTKRPQSLGNFFCSSFLPTTALCNTFQGPDSPSYKREQEEQRKTKKRCVGKAERAHQQGQNSQATCSPTAELCLYFFPLLCTFCIFYKHITTTSLPHPKGRQNMDLWGGCRKSLSGDMTMLQGQAAGDGEGT